MAIAGHSDDTISASHNEKPSGGRSDTIRNLLISEAAGPGREKTFAYGEPDPIARNARPQGRAENRRIDLSVDAATAGEIIFDESLAPKVLGMQSRATVETRPVSAASCGGRIRPPGGTSRHRPPARILARSRHRRSDARPHR